jgi:DNA-binding transcriptional LysR family regulator
MRKVKIVMEPDSSEAVKSAVEATLGVGFISQWALRKQRRLTSLAIVHIARLRIRRTLNFVHALGPEPAGVTRSFLQFACDYGKTLALHPAAATANKKGIYA